MKNFKTRTFSKFHTLNLTQRPELMARSGYAHLVKGYTAFKTPPPTSTNYHERLVTLSRFIARTAFPEKGREARQHYANKDYAAVLNLELARDEELHIDHLSKFVDETPKVEPLDRLQLQIMVLETRIFRQTRVSCLSTISSKFQDPILKSKYRIWVRIKSNPHHLLARHEADPYFVDRRSLSRDQLLWQQWMQANGCSTTANRTWQSLCLSSQTLYSSSGNCGDILR